MVISCTIFISPAERSKPRSCNARIAIRLSSAAGQGRIGGCVAIVGTDQPDFRVEADNDLGLPQKLCRELLLAAYAAYLPSICRSEAKTMDRVSDMGRWLHRWFLRPAASSMAEMLAKAVARHGPIRRLHR